MSYSFRQRSDRNEQQQQYSRPSNYWNGQPHAIAAVQDFGGPNHQYKKKQPQQQMQNSDILSIRIWREGELKPFRKNFYEPHVTVDNRAQPEVDNYRESNNIIVRGSDIPNPNLCFEEGRYPEYVVQVLLSQGFSEPTAIQSQGKIL